MGRYAEHVGASLGAIVEAYAKEAKETAFWPVDRCNRRRDSAGADRRWQTAGV
jgi:hypothetical protein